MNEESSIEVFGYRLSAIENELRELKELLITVPIVVNKLDSLQAETKEELEKLNAKIDNANSSIEKKINSNLQNEITRIETKIKTNEEALRMEARNRMEQAEKRLDAIEINLDLLTKTVNDVRSAGDKKAASRFNYIIDYAWKTLVGIAIGYFIYKLGLPPA